MTHTARITDEEAVDGRGLGDASDEARAAAAGAVEPVPVSSKADIAIAKLIDRLEMAVGPSREMDAHIHEAVTSFQPRRAGVGWPDENMLVVPVFPGWALLPAYTASIDDALSLFPGDDWEWQLEREHTEHTWSASPWTYRAIWGSFIEHEGATAPLAICAAALHAQGIETATAGETEGLDPTDESPVAEGMCP